MIAFVVGIGIKDTALCAIGFVLAISGFAALRGYRWSPVSTLLLGLAMLLAYSYSINSRGFSWKAGLGLAGSLGCVGLALFQVRRQKQIKAFKLEPMASLVLLEKEPRFLDDRLLAAIATSAWGEEFAAKENESGRFVVGEAPTLMVKCKDGCFLVHVVPRPFWERSGNLTTHVSDVRALRALTEHQSWISVDMMGDADSALKERAYDRIGRLLAELAGPKSLAVVQPDTGCFRVWDSTVSETLRSAHPLDCFSAPSSAPVVQVLPDDPVMAAAVEEARRRWPEFVRVFSTRHPEQHFSVKAPVTRGGQTEHIWIDVTALAHGYVRGKLGNDPVDLNGLTLGDPISVPIASVEDWLYVLSSEPVGGFTIPAVTSAPWRARRSM